MKQTIALLALSILIIGIFVNFSNTISIQNSDDTHSKVTIGYNDDLNSTAIAENWPGNGSRTNPFIFENFNITVTSGAAFSLLYTDLHLVIKNCFFSGNGGLVHIYYSDNIQVINSTLTDGNYSGVFLNNANNIQIINNSFVNRKKSISMVFANDTMIKGNKISFDKNHAMNVDLSDYIDIDNNSLTNNALGIYVGKVENSTVSNNVIYNQSEGIRVYTGKNNEFLSNKLINLTFAGMHIYNTESHKIIDNYFSSIDQYGIFLSTAPHNDIINNTLINSTFYFEPYVLLDLLVQNRFENNTINNQDIIFIQSKRDLEISNRNNQQIYILNSTNIGISNLFANNLTQGVFISHSTNVRVSNSAFIGNNYAVSLTSSSFSQIFKNNFTNNVYGIYSKTSGGDTINNNSFSSHYSHALYFDGSGFNINWNDFFEENLPVYSIASNYFRYNFYSSWISPDSNNDGIVDEPYQVSQEPGKILYDDYPITSPVAFSGYSFPPPSTTTTTTPVSQTTTTSSNPTTTLDTSSESNQPSISTTNAEYLTGLFGLTIVLILIKRRNKK
jgi:parallel beta-helix repeat protein